MSDESQEELTVEQQSAPHSGVEGSTRNAMGDRTVADPLRTLEGPDRVNEAEEKARAPQVPGYTVLGVLGRGAMGVVYKAQQQGLKRVVALKMILAGDQAADRDRARFRIEAVAVAQLQHPSIVQIYEIGEHDGKPFFSLEYVEGGSLARKVSSTPLPPRTAAEIIRAMAQAMQYAHEKGIIHCDLKPANVLLTPDGQPKITDFGLAKRLDEESGQTHAGIVLGTPSYMPPEQAEGRLADVGPLSDVYSLGAILYELLTGRAPFRAATMLDTLQQVRLQEPVSPAQLQPGTPRDLETIALKCLQKEPRKRYGSAAELAEDLRRYLAGEGIRARPVSLGERAVRWSRRNPVVASLCAALVVLIVAALIGSSLFSIRIYQEKTAREEETIRANNQAEISRKNEEEAKENERKALKNASVALDRQNVAVRSVVALGHEMEQKLRRSSSNPQAEAEMRSLREDMLRSLRQHIVRLAKEMERARLTEFSMAYGHQVIGDLLRDLGMGAEAIQQYQLADDLIVKAIKEAPNEDRGPANRAVMLARLGDMELDLRADLPRARELYQKALDLQTNVEAHPGNRYYSPIDHKRLKANYLFKLGQVTLQAGDPAKARKQLERCIEFRQDRVKAESGSLEAKGLLAEAHLFLGEVCRRLDDPKAMHKAFQECIDIIDRIQKTNPHHDFKADLAESYLAYAEALFRQGKHDEAKQYFEKCPPLLVIAINKDRQSMRYQGLISRMKYGQGVAALAAKSPLAAQQFADALEWREKLLGIEKESLPGKTAHLLCLARTGKTALAGQQADALRLRLARSPDLLIQLAGCYALLAVTAADPEKKALSEKAMAVLREATKEGYKDCVNLLTHPDLSVLASELAFKELVQKLN
jgi:serine/threonine-protein kinase